MNLEVYRKSCWPKYNPFGGIDRDVIHLNYLNSVWRPGEKPIKVNRLKNKACPWKAGELVRLNPNILEKL